MEWKQNFILFKEHNTKGGIILWPTLINYIKGKILELMLSVRVSLIAIDPLIY